MTPVAPWLPERLPDGWHIAQMRRIATFRNGADYKDVEVSTGGYPVYGSGGEFRRAAQYLYDGDSVLFGRKGTIDKPLLVSGRFWTVDTMFFTELKAGIEPRFLHYYATTMPFDYYSTNTALPSMTQGELGGHRLALPPVPEQRAIADFLDRETVRIDMLIEEQQRLIALSRERRTAVRTERALKGTRPTNLAASPLPWAKRLPSEWQVVPLTSVARLESGHTPSRTRDDWWEDCYIPWISLNDVGAMRETKYLETTTHQLSDEGIANSSARLLPANTVVLSRDATVGRTSIMRIAMATSQHFAAWICGPRLDPEYLWTLFTDAMQPYFASFQNGSTIRTIGMGDLKAFRIPLPPLDEQRRIVAHLDEQTAQIDNLIAESERFVELARERRSALIAAAVTGQIDVRSEVA